MCMNESSTDQTYPHHIVLNGRKYVPVGTPAPKRQYISGQRWLGTDGATYEIQSDTCIHNIALGPYSFTLFGAGRIDDFLVQLVRNAPAIEVKPGMLIRGLRIGSECAVLQSSPLKVATLGHEDGVEMAMTDDAEVCWPWDTWKRVYPEVTAAQQRASSP